MESLRKGATSCERILAVSKRPVYLGANFWAKAGHKSRSELKDLIDAMFPTFTYGNQTFRSMFIGGVQSDDKVIDGSYQNVKEFPDETYNWPGLKDRKEGAMWGTEWTQHLIFKHQFPLDCSDKNLLELDPWNYGLGASLIEMARILGWAMRNGYILTSSDKPWIWTKGDYCQNDTSMTCFLEPLTNCSRKSVRKVRHMNNDQMLQLVTLSIIKADKIVPDSVKVMLQHSPYDLQGNAMLNYWERQGFAFVCRLNKRTVQWIKTNMIKDEESLLGIDLNVHIRHGDKVTEMRLVTTSEYLAVIDMISKLTGKDRLSVFLTSEDGNTVRNLQEASPYNIIVLNHTRSGGGGCDSLLNNSANIALISFADLYGNLRPQMNIRTSLSNWARLVEALRSTVGRRGNELVFETQRLGSPCLTVNHCICLHEYPVNIQLS